MGRTIFQDTQTVVAASWLNKVDRVLYDQTSALDSDTSGTGITVGFEGTAPPTLQLTTANATDTKIGLDVVSGTLSLKNAAVNCSMFANSTLIAVNWNADSLTLDNLVVTGNTEQSGGVRNHIAQLVYPEATGTQDGLTLRDLDVTGMSYSFLKGNADTGDQTRIKVWGGHYHDNYAVDLAFNSPAAGSSIADVLVIGASFPGNKGAEVTGNSSHRMTAAGNVSGFRFIANHASGQGQELARVEETAALGIIALNTADLSSGSQNGIEVTDNDVGGTHATPHELVLLGNALKGTTAANRYGISLVSDASPAPPLYNSIVLGNVLDTWESGLRTAKESERNLLVANIVSTATNGIKAVEPSLGVTENLLIDCTNQFSLDRGGMFGRMHFRQTDTEVPELTSMLDGTALCVAVRSWTYETQRFDITDAASTDYDLMPLGLMMSGTLTMMLYTNAPVPGYTAQRADVEWDGTTFRFTDLGRKASGAVVLSATDPVLNNAGKLAMRVVNGSGVACSGVRVQIVFDGLHLWD